MSESDLKFLDDYRRSFDDAYEFVVRIIREKFKLELTGRAAKSTISIIAKLNRESIRLSQIQDIAGCRIIAASVIEQERIVVLLRDVFSGASVIDRRVYPSYGYRAVHVIAKVSEKLIEIQVRSRLQHLWAELSEKISDKIDPMIKYGGGGDAIQRILMETSELIGDYETGEIKIVSSPENFINLPELQIKRVILKEKIRTLFNDLIVWVENQEEQKL